MRLLKGHCFFVVCALGMAWVGCFGGKCVKEKNSPRMIAYTENFPPFNYPDEKGNVVGISADLLRHIANEMGFINLEIHCVPWEQAYEKTKARQVGKVAANIVLHSAVRTPEREGLFKWAGPIVDDYSTCVLGLNTNRKIAAVKKLADIAQYTVALIPDDVDTQYLMNQKIFSKDPSHVIFEKGIAECVKSLYAGKCDLIVMPFGPAKIQAQNNHLDVSLLQKILPFVKGLAKSEIYFAFSRETSDEVVRKFQKILDAFKKSPAYSNMINRYLQMF
jgi:polar amino acid transport system substrate-binding protein